MKNRLVKQENGSVAVYAIATVLCFVFLLSGMFYSSTAIRKNQLKTVLKLKEIYAQEIELQNKDYVKAGLVLQYDGINNTGNGHSNNTTAWKDLSGHGNDGTLSRPLDATFSWENNNISIAGASSTLGTYVDTPLNLNGKERTIFYTIDGTNLTGSIWGDTDNDNTNGLFNYNTFIANRGSSTSTQSRYDYTFAKSGKSHYAVTLSATQLKFYVNGVLTNTTNNTVGLTTSNNLRVLAAYFPTQNATNLKMYDFMVYNRVLNDQEILQNYEVDKLKYGL